MAAFRWGWAAVGLMLGAVPAAADVVYRTNGGRIVGTIVEAPSDTTVVTVKSRFGTFKIPRSEIERIEYGNTVAENYTEAAKKFGSTAGEQLKLALWCQDNGYRKEYQRHLEKVIELDPDHAEARRRLGFQRENGKWVTRDAALAAKGLVTYKGRTVLPQEKEILERKAQDSETQREWYRKVRIWQKYLRGGDKSRHGAATTELLEVRDPLAVKPLVEFLGERGNEEERRLLIDVLAAIDSDMGTATLIKAAVADTHADNRAAAIEVLKERKSPELLAELTRYLRDNDNKKVRTAAVALGALGDHSVVPALVEALVTTHKTVIKLTVADKVRAMAGVPKLRTSYDPATGRIVRRAASPSMTLGSGGVTYGTQSDKEIIIEEIRNAEVLEALRTLTDQSLGYDKDRWLDWLRQSYRRDAAKIAK